MNHTQYIPLKKPKHESSKTEREQYITTKQVGALLHERIGIIPLTDIKAWSSQAVHNAVYISSTACFIKSNTTYTNMLVRISFYFLFFRPGCEESRNFCDVRKWITASHKRKKPLCNVVKAIRTKEGPSSSSLSFHLFFVAFDQGSFLAVSSK